MAATVTKVRHSHAGVYAIHVYDVTIGTYATGGVAVTPSQVGLKTVVAVLDEPATKSDNTKIAPVKYDRTNSKLIAFGTAASSTGLTEIADTTDLSTFTARLAFIGHK